MKTSVFLKIQFWLFIVISAYFSLAPQPPGILATSDKVLHASGYFLLFLSCNLAYQKGGKLPLKLILLFIFSLLMEVIQHFVPNRHFSLLDLLANLTGLSAGYLILSLLWEKPSLETRSG